MPFLELEGKPDLDGNPREFSGELMVGSGSQATWRLAGQDLAARHFKLRANPDGTAFVTPASPQNVIVLDGTQVPPEGSPVATGAVVAAGGARFVFLAKSDSPRPPAPGPLLESHLVDDANRKGYTLRKRVVQIGREIGCSIVLKDPTVSRFHADVRNEAGEYVIYSMGSAGTRINGEAVNAPQILVEGDQIAVGDTLFTFTRQALPAGVRPVQFEDHSDDDAFSRRSTQLAQRAVTLEAGRQPSPPRGLPIFPMLVGVAIVSIMLVIYLVFR